jgi:hypothetical protein
MPDSTLSTLAQIKTKVRRLTRSMSEQQLSDAELENYINTAVLYDFPEHLRHFNLKTTFSFYTEPYVAVYENNTTDTSNPLYNFKNRYLTFNPPAYISGYQVLWSESENQFYGIYPKINSIITLNTGDGSTTSFSGNINTSLNSQPSSGAVGLIVAGSILFESQDLNGLGISLIDYPNPTPSNIMGALAPVGYTGSLVGYPYGSINYLTGDYTATFASAPASAANINVQCQFAQPSIPQTILFYDGKFTLGPIPDQVYKVTIEAYIRPTELLNDTQEPELSEWWQFISYLAAKKIFEDRMDLESVQMILPEFRNQMNLINRRTIVQQTTQRTQTIYTEQLGASGAYGAGWFSSGSGGGGF